MPTPTRRNDFVPWFSSNFCALIAALLLLSAVLTLVSACGSEDLVFPGNVPATPTSGNTATPDPDDE